MMTLGDRVHIARRFQRSVRIDSDLGDGRALEGFVCPQSSANVLLSMARHIAETGQGAFTWTGPYGSGKSSLAVALSALLSVNADLRAKAEYLFSDDVANAIRTALPPGINGWRILPVVGRREHPVRVIGEAIDAGELGGTKSPGEWTENRLVKTLVDIAMRNPETDGGIIVFIDEMGKFLEAVVHEKIDIYLFQQLAEAASRSNGRLILIGVLHQAFEEYAQRLSHEMRDEWAKIQGRFIDLVVNANGEEQIELISRAIESDRRAKAAGRLAKTIATLARRDRPAGAKQLAATLEACWPLHPVVACLLGPVSRRRFGQNQRSIFGFLNSSEPYGFQDFLKRTDDSKLYSPDMLWEYLRANLEPSILASPDGHRWALAAEALERCDATSGESLHLKLLKTIAIVDLFKERSGLVASFDLLGACLCNYSKSSLKEALVELKQSSFIIYKKFADAYAIFAGSDFDIDQAVKDALEGINEIDFKELKNLAGLQPILAKRHYHETGALRWLDVNLAPLTELLDSVVNYKPAKGTIGQFLLAIPTQGESEEHLAEACREAARHSDSWDNIVGWSNRSWSVVNLARELIALENVRNNRPELAGDPVARREVSARLSTLQARLETELRKAVDGTTWYRKHHRRKSYRQAELNSLASELAGRRFNQSPRLHNELLNRQKPSPSAISAQNTLLKRMVLHEGAPRLGIKGFPAEGGLLVSLLESTGLYANSSDGWRFVTPEEASGEDSHKLAPLWIAARNHIKENAKRTVSVAEIYDIWRKEPFGVKDGLMPVLTVAFILSQRESMAVYREGIFRARFDDLDVEYMAKDPGSLQLRWMDLSEFSRRLLLGMAEIVRDLDKENSLVHLEPINVARGLVAIYEQLPPWTKRTMRLSANAMRVRNLFKRARDPNQFLFDDIPETVGDEADLASDAVVQRIVNGVREGLEELVQAYSSMLNRLRVMMLAELQVPNLSPQSLAELRDRAENIRQLAGDFRLDAFVGRLIQFKALDADMEGIASLAANKPPRDWVDPDLDRAAIEITDMAQKFLRAETFARVKGRPEKRQTMAVVIGMEGRPAPILEEFSIADADRDAVNALIVRITGALEEADTDRRNVILAALAELSARYMQQPAIEEEGKERIVS
jgi:hypothetical protein